jgi:hypothetical protein
MCSFQVAARMTTPGKFYKRESQEKNFPCGWNFSTFAAHVIEQDLCRPSLPCARPLHMATQRFGFFSTSDFHRLFANEAYQFRNQQSRTLVKLATMVLSGTRGPWLFLVIREGLAWLIRQKRES